MRTEDTLAESGSDKVRRWALCLGVPLLLAGAVLIAFLFGGSFVGGTLFAIVCILFFATSRQNDKKVAASKLSCSAIDGDETIVLNILQSTQIDQSDLLESLLWACNFGHANVVKIILDHGGPVNGQMQFEIGNVTPLFIACLKGDEQIVKMLIDRGGNINVECVLYASDGAAIWKGTTRDLATERGGSVLESLIQRER